tara:strand:- start:1625 stop:2629 length:1005 start_codon:yes stop_codon:yes gene_type:complete
MKYIQLIGTQRSGSNLLRLMLNQLDGICAPHPPHILSVFLPILSKYGNLEKSKNLDYLILDVIECIKLNPIKWENLSISVDMIKSKLKNPSIFQIFSSIYELYADQFDSKFWMCKSLINMNYFNQIEKEKLNPIYIYIYRDGRDVDLSFKKAIVGPKHSYFTAKKWLNDQTICEKIKTNVSRSRFISVKYEDLILHPKKTLFYICEKIKVKYNDKVLDYYKSNESKVSASAGEMWSNLSKPILINNSSKFIKNLNKEELQIFESIAIKPLKNLGYNLINNDDDLISRFSDLDIERFTNANSEIKLHTYTNANKKDLIQMEPYENFKKNLVSKVF